MAGIERTATIANKRGLHARAAAKFVQTVNGFEAEIIVTKGGQSVSGSSIMGLMMLAAAMGTDIHLAASGADAEAAVDAICELIDARFEED